MAAQGITFTFVTRPIMTPPTEPQFPPAITFISRSRAAGFQNSFNLNITRTIGVACSRRNLVQVSAVGDRTTSSGSGGGGGGGDANINYVVPLDYLSPGITRPLAEILRDLNKRIPDSIIVKQQPDDNEIQSSFIPWYHANRMLSFYAPGWCGEIRDVIFSDTGSVTVVYRVTVRGSDGEAHRESTGTVPATNDQGVDPVAAAEELAFCKACARFGLGLYLYHED